MPVVLLQIDARDSASAGIAQASRSLDQLVQSVGKVSGASSSALSGYRSLEEATRKVESAQAGYRSAIVANDAALRGAIQSTESYQRAQVALASATGSGVQEQIRLAQSFNAMVNAQDRSAVSTRQYASALSELAIAQEKAARTPSAGGGGGGGRSYGSLRGGPTPSEYALNFLKYQVGYQALGDVQSAIGGAVQDNNAYSRMMGMTAATTGVTPAQYGAFAQSTDKYVTGVAGSGTQPYNKQQVLAADYGLLSVGVAPRQAEQINTMAVRLSSAAGEPDPTNFADSNRFMLSAYGKLKSPNIVAESRKNFDQLAVLTNMGAYKPPEVPGIIGAAGLATAAQQGISSGDALAFLGHLSLGGIPHGDAGNVFHEFTASFLDPHPSQVQQARSMDVNLSTSGGGVFQRYGGLAGFTSMLTQKEANWSDSTKASQNEQLFGNQGGAAAFAQIQGLHDAAGHKLGIEDPIFKAEAHSVGTSDTMYKTSQLAPGVQIADAEAKLKTQIDGIFTAIQPFQLRAIKSMGDFADALTRTVDQFKRIDPTSPLAAANKALGHFITPGDKGSGNWDVSMQEANYDLNPRLKRPAGLSPNDPNNTLHLPGAGLIVPKDQGMGPDPIRQLALVALEGLGIKNPSLPNLRDTLAAGLNLLPHLSKEPPPPVVRAPAPPVRFAPFAPWALSGGSDPVPPPPAPATPNPLAHNIWMAQQRAGLTFQDQQSTPEPQHGRGLYVQPDATAPGQGGNAKYSALPNRPDNATALMNEQQSQMRLQLAINQGASPKTIRAAEAAALDAINNGPSTQSGIARALQALDVRHEANNAINQPLVTAAQRQYDAAVLMNESPAKILAAVGTLASAEKTQITGGMEGTAKQAALRSLDAQTTALTHAQNIRTQDRVMQSLSAGMQIDILRQDPRGFARDSAALLASRTQNAQRLNLTPNDLRLEGIRNRQATADLTQQPLVTAAQQNYQAAQLMQATPAALKQVFNAYLDAERALAHATLGGKPLQQQLRAVGIQGQQFAYQQQGEKLSRDMAHIDAKIAEDRRTGNIADLQKQQTARIDLERKNLVRLNMDPEQLKNERLQNQFDLRGFLLPPPTPFRVQQRGIGDLGSADMSTTARFGGGVDPQTAEIRKLVAEVARLHEMVGLLQDIKRNTSKNPPPGKALAGVNYSGGR